MGCLFEPKEKERRRATFEGRLTSAGACPASSRATPHKTPADAGETVPRSDWSESEARALYDLPFPELLAWAAALTEAGGAILLLFGFAVRWISIPLIVTMLVAIFAVHWPYGWQAIADPSAPFANERVLAAAEKLERARSILREHGNYDWLTGSGKFVVLNNGIEFAATYLVMLVALFFSGAGRWLSIDYWLARRFRAPR